MVITVTMNPAMDKTIEIDRFVYGELNRIRRVELDVGGKGINVSKTIAALGGKSIATGFLGGRSGRMIADFLKEHGIDSDFVWVQGETRTNTKVIEADGTLTELNEPGTYVCEGEMQKLKEKLTHYANEDAIFVFAGSIPQGVSEDIYKELIHLVKGKSAYVLLDADGEAFQKGLEAKPNVIKPNKAELNRVLEMEGESELSELIAGAKMIQQKGIENVVVSLGGSGAIFLLGEDAIVCKSLLVPVASSVGAGDAMVAALAYARERQLNREETINLCMAASAGAVTTSGTKPPVKEVVDGLMKQVKIEIM